MIEEVRMINDPGLDTVVFGDEVEMYRFGLGAGSTFDPATCGMLCACSRGLS